MVEDQCRRLPWHIVEFHKISFNWGPQAKPLAKNFELESGL